MLSIPDLLQSDLSITLADGSSVNLSDSTHCCRR
ncbi:MAG: hypothetical protein QOI59_4084 [Gammaproteobacteria bacterium]|nr:hypothetical protein [Gammaproteobacteria bacterium]